MRTWLVVLLLSLPVTSYAAQNDAEILELARQVMTKVRYAALITVDPAGQPRSRIVDPFTPDKNFVVYVATRPNTRKVAQIRVNDQVTLFYFDPEDRNYVSVMGKATLVDDEQIKQRKRRSTDSDRIYPHFPADYLLIKIEPLWLEGVLPGYRGDPETWKPVQVRFTDPESSAK